MTGMWGSARKHLLFRNKSSQKKKFRKAKKKERASTSTTEAALFAPFAVGGRTEGRKSVLFTDLPVCRETSSVSHFK